MATPPTPPDPNAPIKAETDRLKAQAELEKARAEMVRAYGLPSFEGKTTLNANAGAIEALVLATDAVDAAAGQIAAEAAALPSTRAPRPFLILAGDEALDLGLAASVLAEIAAFEAIFDDVPSPTVPRAESLGIAGSIAAVSAIAGLLRTETTVTAVDHTAAISHRVLATAVAGKLLGRAVLPAAAVGGMTSSRLIARLMALASRRDEVTAAIPGLPDEEGERLKAALGRYDAFFARVTSADATGRVPVVQAARLEQVVAGEPLVLRIYVEKAGGSLIQRKNIWTFFGADPVRVSGALVASYTVTHPDTGMVLAARVLNCRTVISTLRKIQSGPSAPNLNKRPPVVEPSANLIGRSGGRSVLGESLSSLLQQQGAGAVANYFNIAGDAIEAIVINAQPNARHTWPDDIPKTNWGMLEHTWEGTLDEIKREFGERIDPAQFSSNDPFNGSWSKDLTDLQWRLAQSVQP